MTIETKFNIGDEVWFKSEGELHCGIISSTQISVMTIHNRIDIEVLYRLRMCIGYPFTTMKCENEVFSTNQELLNSL